MSRPQPPPPKKKSSCQVSGEPPPGPPFLLFFFFFYFGGWWGGRFDRLLLILSKRGGFGGGFFLMIFTIAALRWGGGGVGGVRPGSAPHTFPPLPITAGGLQSPSPPPGTPYKPRGATQRVVFERRGGFFGGGVGRVGLAEDRASFIAAGWFSSPAAEGPDVSPPLPERPPRRKAGGAPVGSEKGGGEPLPPTTPESGLSAQRVFSSFRLKKGVGGSGEGGGWGGWGGKRFKFPPPARCGGRR